MFLAKFCELQDFKNASREIIKHKMWFLVKFGENVENTSSVLHHFNGVFLSVFVKTESTNNWNILYTAME